MLTVAGCATRLPEPITLPQTGVRAPSHFDQVHDYPGAAAAIAAVLERELGVRPFPLTFHFYPGQKAFETALIGFGQDPLTARDTAEVMRAVGMRGRVLLNNDSLEPLAWRDRVRVLAHEVVHSLQYELAGGIRGTSDQWLREGFAEWVALVVVDRLGGRPFRNLRDQQLAVFRGSNRARAPRLDEMVTFEQWVAMASRDDIASYPQAFLAVDFLVERHGLPAVIQYFAAFATTADRNAAFHFAFGEERAAFEAAADAALGIRRR